MKTNLKNKIERIIKKTGLTFTVFVFVILGSFAFASNFVFAEDTTPPDVNITYSNTPMGAGSRTITASYSEEVASAPTISIDQPGSADISNASMTAVPGASSWVSKTIEASSWSSVTYGNGLFVAVGYNGESRGVATSPDGTTWTARTAQANTWSSVTYGNDLFVAVAPSGTNRVMTSSDGITWTGRTAAAANTWRSVTYSNGLFVAVSDGGTNRIMTSSDGITWTSRTASENYSWQSVTYGNGLFVAVAYGASRVMTSIDGINWTIRTIPEANAWRSVTYGNGVFVAVSSDGTNRVMTSADGITWIARTAAVVNTWYSVTYGNGLFVALAQDGTNRVMTSPDGITWTARSATEANNWMSVTYGNGLFVAVAASGTNRVMVSPLYSYSYNYTVNQANGSNYIDGIATISLSSVTDVAGNTANAPTNNTFTIETVAPTPTLTYSVSNPVGVGVNTITATYPEPISTAPTVSINQPGSTDISNASMNSPGSVWTARIPAELNAWRSVTYGNGLFVAVSYNGTNRVMTSPDGITWTARAAAEASSWTSVTYGNGLFVAVAYGGTNRVMTSPDGITWTARSVPLNSWRSITYGNGVFVAVSSDGTNRVMTSADGSTWTARTAAQDNTWQSVTYGNGLFVAVSDSGTNRAMTSHDGVTWTARAAAESNQTNFVTYGNGLFVSVNTNGSTVFTSPDGVTWTARNSFIGTGSFTIINANGVFVAVGSGGITSISLDGITWTAIAAQVSASYWRGVAYGDGKIVAVADGGTNRVMTSSANYSYDYNVIQANGSNYIDGTATVSLSSVTDVAGNTSSAPLNNTFTIDTTGPNVSLTYSAERAKAGSYTITATYSSPVATAPYISINQPGSTDISNVQMSGSGAVYTYTYTVNTANASTYIDGQALVSLTTVNDLNGKPAGVPKNTFFIIDTALPTPTITYTSNPIKAGTQTINVSFPEAITTTPTLSINQQGTTDISNASMTNTGGSVWTSRSATGQYLVSITYGNGLFVAIPGASCQNCIVTSPDGITWTARNVAEANSWTSVTYGNGLFVAVSSDGTNRVMTSPDGITWTARTAAEANSWYSVTYGNSLFVAVSENGTNRVMTSPDGITWTARTAAQANYWSSVTYGNGLFVVVANGSGIMTSPDGITWTAITAVQANWWRSVTYGNGLFVAVSSNGTNRVMTSPDGITWTARTAAEANGWRSVTYGNGLFVAVAQTGTNRVMTSPDGITWTTRTAPEANSWMSVAYGNGLFVASSWDGTNRIMTSPSFSYSYPYTVNTADGSNYVDGTASVSLTEVSDTAGNTTTPTSSFIIDTTGPVADIRYTSNPSDTGVNTINAVYNEGIASAPTVSINQQGSTDITNASMTAPAVTWTARTAAEANQWYSVTYGNGLFVAVASSRVMTSPDGITWTTRTAPSNAWKSVIYGNGIFVAVASNGAMTSSDGITWTARTAPLSSWYSVTYGNGLFVAVADNGTNRVMTSPDGITWTARTAAEANQWYSVTYGNGLFVAVARYLGTGSSQVMTSPDGITWTARTAPQNYQWTSVTYGNGLFVAVAWSSYFMSSPDGINWTIRYAPESNNWNFITYGNGLFVAVANTGTNRVTTSPDGITWTARTAAQANSWWSVTSGNGKFVAVALDGTNRVMTSNAGYTYDYTVNQGNGSTYIDGVATVSLSSVNDLVGNASLPPTNATFTINTVNPDVALSYTKNIAGVGTNTITATYTKPVASAPTISINQPGSTDITNASMTGSGMVYTYNYTVNSANGSTYIDGEATVSLSTVNDLSGKPANAPTNTTFTIDTIPPTANITYDLNRAVKSGDTLTITATFNEDMADAPIPQIAISGSNTLALADMTKVDARNYTYSHTVASGNGVSTVTLGTGTDIPGNVVTTVPTSGATFTVDNTLPTGTISSICETEGNACTTAGSLLNPQGAYTVAVISGTGTDGEGGNGINNVEVSIKNTTTNKWYGGSSFSSDTEVFYPATGTTDWSFDFSSISLEVDNFYLVTAKIYDGALNPNTATINFKFVNSPPIVSNVVATVDIENQLVDISYDVTDIESTQTTNYLFYNIEETLAGNISDTDDSLFVSDASSFPASGVILIEDEIIAYASKTGNTLSSLTRGHLSTTASSHVTNDTIYIKSNAVSGSGIGQSNLGTGKEIVWNFKDDVISFESNTGVVKVVANDGSAGSMIGSLVSNTFILDAKISPTVMTFDAGVAGETDSAVINITKPEDISDIYYMISDDESIESNPNSSGWVLMEDSVSVPWTFDSDVELKKIKYKFKDSYQNETSEYIISTHTPVPTSSFIAQDTSNISANPPYYDIYIGWQATDVEGFDSYKLEYATSSDNVTYTSYQDITTGDLDTVSTNYFIHRNLNSSSFYKYRLGVLDTDGNISVRSNSSIVTKPDGVQNYGEGGGGSVATSPKVENVVVSQNVDKTVSVSYKLTDTSLSKKVNPTYEAYLFYNTGITLANNALVSNTLTISDASKLKSSGYILVNNEVLSYSSKTGNTLNGIVRGTWPTVASSGRSTRTNTSMFSGTPVWVMASGTTPIAITNTSIEDGQDGNISWDTFTESSLTGNSYTNVGIKVVVHDKQDALSGPISNQNDYSENGILNTLDLLPPTVSFTASSSTGQENITPVTISASLAHSYPLISSALYTISGTAINGSDYVFEAGVLNFEAGVTTASLEIPINDDTLKEVDETIIITLSSGTNLTLGENIIYTYTINDDDSFSGVQFTNTESEGEENITSVNIPVAISEIAGANVTVAYTVTGGTATSGSDFTLASGTATIVAGELSADIVLVINNDVIKEDDKTIIITISDPVNATLGSNTVFTYTILDDDEYPTLSFDNVTSEDSEGTNTINIPVSISAIYEEDITFSYVVTGGSATGGGVDYTLVDGTGTITAGDMTTDIDIIIFDDELAEDTETILITISNPVNAVLGINTIHAHSIIDNEIEVNDISGSSVKATSALITWTTSDYTDSLIEYGTISPGTEGAYSMSKSNSEKVLNHSIYLGNLTPSTTYYFRTTSTNLAGETTISESEFTTTAGPVISNVSSVDATDISITITWTTDILANSYVTYSTNSDLSDSIRFGTGDFVTDHLVVLNGLSPEMNYYYKVDSTDESNNIGEDANDGDYYEFVTGEDATAPIISEIEVPIITATQVAITWKTNELSSGKVLYGTSSSSYENETTLIETPLTNHLAALSELSENTNYYFVVEVSDDNGNTTTSEEQTFETTEKEQVIISRGGGGTSGVAQELYDLLLKENESYKAKVGTLNTEVPVISDIEVSDITPFGATVSFTTSEETIAFVEYGKKINGLDLIVADKSWAKTHTIVLHGLSLGTEYIFKVNAMDKTNDFGYSPEEEFTTKFLSEDLEGLKNIDNVEQFQAEIEATIESILPSLVPPFIDKPVISEITESSAKISFRTNIKAYPIVSYVAEDEYDEKKDDPYKGEMSDTSEKRVSHTINLIGLKPNTRYHFMAKAFSLPQVVGKSEDLIFTTADSKINGSVLDIKKDSFNVVWTTDNPTSSIVEYKNLKTGVTLRINDENLTKSHAIKVENLTPGTFYQVKISGINEKGNLVESGEVLNVKTSTDNQAPIITNLKVDSALVVGRTDRVQTIVSWQTDEPSTSTVYYEEGSGSVNKELANKQEDLNMTKNHVMILTSLKPGTIYRFSVSSVDDVNNVVKTPVRTIITPRKTESIVDVIFKNFDETFNFVNNVR